MENVMVVFSSTDIAETLIERALGLATDKQARLIILDVRDRDMSEKVGELTENIGFMGEKVVSSLKKQISQGRCDVIYKKLSILEDAAIKEDIPYEIVVERGPFIESILKVAKTKKVTTIICQTREAVPTAKDGFEVIHI